jgi:hypothetical protein
VPAGRGTAQHAGAHRPGGIHVPFQVRERITNCDDPDILDQWLIRAATAPTAEEIFADE